jgi:hypothetical protein
VPGVEGENQAMKITFYKKHNLRLQEIVPFKTIAPDGCTLTDDWKTFLKTFGTKQKIKVTFEWKESK